MTSPSVFGINLNSIHYQRQGNKFVAANNDAYFWCTEFAYGRAMEKGLFQNNQGIGARISGHAGFWDDNVGASNWGRQVRANSIVVWDPNQGGAGSVGHVGFVERVNSDGSFTISEANWDRAEGRFNSRTITRGSNAFNTAKFIYLSGGSTPLPPTNPFRGTEGNDRIDGNSGNNTLEGLGGNDTLYGEAGNDVVLGGAGNDYLDGYASYRNTEFDTLTGGSGVDTFALGNTRQGAFYQGEGHAVITDYSFRDDYIQLRGSASGYRLAVSGSDTLIYLNNSNDLIGIVKGVTDMSLTARPGRVDFTFV